MLTVKEAAAKWNISEVRVRQYLKDGRIEGAVKVGRDWIIPVGAPRPKLLRVWNGARPARARRSSGTGTE